MMQTTQLVRRREANATTVIETLDDTVDPAAIERRMSAKPTNEDLERLSREVHGMAQVFEDANKARDEQRKVMDQMHYDLLARIEATREYMSQEVVRLEATLDSFKRQFEHRLRELREDLMTKLNTKITAVRAQIAKLNVRIDEIDANLRTEVEERKKQMQEILVPIQKDVAQLVVQLEEEQQARRAKEGIYHKSLQDAVDLIEKNLDIEKFNREQQYMDFKVLGEYERERILKRQYVIEYEMKKALDVLDVNIQAETSNRLDTQDGIVKNMTSFIKAFQDNIKEEASMG